MTRELFWIHFPSLALVTPSFLLGGGGGNDPGPDGKDDQDDDNKDRRSDKGSIRIDHVCQRLWNNLLSPCHRMAKNTSLLGRESVDKDAFGALAKRIATKGNDSSLGKTLTYVAKLAHENFEPGRPARLDL
jgi:hypothetical protein